MLMAVQSYLSTSDVPGCHLIRDRDGSRVLCPSGPYCDTHIYAKRTTTLIVRMNMTPFLSLNVCIYSAHLSENLDPALIVIIPLSLYVCTTSNMFNVSSCPV